MVVRDRDAAVVTVPVLLAPWWLPALLTGAGEALFLDADRPSYRAYETPYPLILITPASDERVTSIITLPEPIWTRLCVAWGVFFLFLGTLNLWVAYNFSTDAWVNFKVWGGIGLFFLLAVATVASVARYLPDRP